MNIGKSVIIKGELISREDLTIDGQVEGTIELKDHTLTIGSTGKIKAGVFAKTLIVMGAINGKIAASEKVDIRDGAARGRRGIRGARRSPGGEDSRGHHRPTCR